MIRATRMLGAACVCALALLAPQQALEAQNGVPSPLLKDFVWRSIGPANLGGRTDDVEAVESNPYIVYIGTATSGVWKTENNGTTWTPIFDGQPNQSIGDIAIAPSNPNIVWVGTGEANTRQSTSYGAGIFKSTDAGKTWTFMGMPDSGHIGRIVIDPKNPDIVYVAAAGDVFKAHPDRGLYKTVDGGKTWTKSKFIDDDTGFIEVAMDPSNPNVLIAASYQRRRTSWGFNGGGPGSALWKTTDAGRNWRKIEGGGLPPYGKWGRVGLDFSRSNPNTIYALIEPGPPPGQGQGGGGGGGGQQNPNAPPDPLRPGLWRSDDKGTTWRLMSNENGRPMYFSQVRVDPKNPNTVYVLERSLAKSTDSGKTWTILSESILARLQNPSRPSAVGPYDRGYAGALPPSHPDHHAMWINPNNPRHIWLGHDGGVDISYDAGKSWSYVNWMPMGQFYEVAVDNRHPYVVYGGAQDNGIWAVPSAVRNGGGITKEHAYEIAAGDGYHVRVDPTDWATVYASVSGGGGQHIWRYNLKTGEQKYIRPTAARRPGQTGPGQNVAVGPEGNIATPMGPNDAIRFNWNPGFILSPHNPSVLYFGGNRLFKSYDRGNTWIATKDLSNSINRDQLQIMGVSGTEPMASKNDGVSAWGTIVAIAESPVLPGVLWVGTDDGALQVSRDGGATWASVADNAMKFQTPPYVESIEVSPFDAGTAFVAFDGHLNGDFRPHLYKTTDYGKTWTSISSNLPARGHINVVRADKVNRNLMFVGTEFGFYVTLDGGKQWAPFMNNLPSTISDDVLVHPREQDLVLATHGRSFLIIDDISPLQQLTDEVMGKAEHLFQPRVATLWDHDRQAWHGGGDEMWRGSNPPDAVVSYYLKGQASGPVKVQITDAAGTLVRELDGAGDAGIRRVTWDLRKTAPPPPAAPQGGFGGNEPPQGERVTPGTYIVKLNANGRTATTILTVQADPNRP
jgi:photosystem II stability/assembly factor-like uncharacterized protein